MHRLLLLLLFAPLVTLAQPAEGTFTLELIGSIPEYDGPSEMTGPARFGGAAAGAEVPSGTNSVLTFRSLNRTRVTLYSKDVYRPGLRAPRRYPNTHDPGNTTYAPPHDIVSGVPGDFHGLSLFDYGLRLDFPDGRIFYSHGRPDGPSGNRDFRITYSTDDEVRGSVRVPIREDGASYATGAVLLTFSATPSETPLPGLQPGQALVVVTGEHEMMTTLPATWGRGTETSGCAGCNPWILRFGAGTLFAGNALDIVGQRPQDAPNAMSSIGWGGFRPGANGQAPLGFVRSSMLYSMMLPGEIEPYHSAGRPGKPFDLRASPGTAPYSLGGGDGLGYARIYADDRGPSEDERSYVGWTDFHAWKARMNPLPREVQAVIRISVRYHTPDGPSDPPEQIAGPNMGQMGSFTARIRGTQVSGSATSMDSGAGFQFQMMGSGAAVGSVFSFGSRGDLRRHTYSLTAPRSGPPTNSQAIGSLTTTDTAGRQMSCVFQSGTLRITSIADDSVEGTFRGNTQCRTPSGTTVQRNVTGGEFTAVRPMVGGQVSLPDCVTLPPGVNLPANSPIPACTD
ncbi:MAG: hypothetical protein Rubg2KO_17470 [Rubricoccaceae bacterium]